MSFTKSGWLALLLLPAALLAQQDTVRGQAQTSPRRIFGIIPNYRTSPRLTPYVPLRTKEKFKLSLTDATDRGTFILAGFFAAEAQLTNADPAFGQGVKGFARYFGTAYADYTIGDIMTEAIYPSLLHQDPRYFRIGEGSTVSRLGWAVKQIFWTHTDSNHWQFNFSEIVGNATAVGISNAYYPDNRNLSNFTVKLGTQIAVDLAGNILKEFSPDLSRKFSRHHTPRP